MHRPVVIGHSHSHQPSATARSLFAGVHMRDINSRAKRRLTKASSRRHIANPAPVTLRPPAPPPTLCCDFSLSDGQVTRNLTASKQNGEILAVPRQRIWHCTILPYSVSAYRIPLPSNPHFPFRHPCPPAALHVDLLLCHIAMAASRVASQEGCIVVHDWDTRHMVDRSADRPR